ncbi:carbohydrate-binding family 9-like protein [Mucilaginibacter glaciei]|uniref:Carbohydrate-binding family 9-like protein n=1 Tax=Mucilaginibacter glaciei TaxID=2772109 RepID=A0A926S2K1_9SPHI|nr:carbohydrate-binding family 9-like protein [Mucilaginibacter glaciei]MBD1395200.1 carbohydrate-binding family 9-like protein [Mucilaginibacter glaciei]
MFIKNRLLLIALWGVTQQSLAQDAFKAIPYLFTQPKNYTVTYTGQSPKIDGNINDVVWQQAAWTDSFVDIEGDLKPKPNLNTRLKMLWNDSCLFIAVQMQEPHLWANLTKHDQIIFNDNDFEIFIDPDNDAREYFEIEVNQRNKIFDLFLPKPYRDRGDALISWDAPGMQSAVQLQGTLNNPKDTDTGWTAEFKIPFSAIKMGFGKGAPAEGAIWRINFSRVEWDTQIKNGKYVKLKDAKGKNLPERNWVWSPQGIINMHAPERWGYLQFSKKSAVDKDAFQIPYTDMQRKYLWLIYYNQQKYYRQNQVYTANLSELGLSSPKVDVSGVANTLSVTASSYQFSAAIGDGKTDVLTINNDGLIRANKLAVK